MSLPDVVSRPLNEHPAFLWLAPAIADLNARDLWRELRVRESPHVGGRVQISGRSLVDFASNDYLGLSARSELVVGMQRVVQQVGVGSGASPWVTGYGVWHRRLEEDLAAWEGAEAVTVFTSGYAANVSTIPALVRRGDVVYSDSRNHASIIDGCRLSGARIEIFRHADPQHLSQLLESREQYARALIVSDTLFSMDGDFADVPRLRDLAERHRAMLLLDEAHATGVWGERGRGILELQGVDDPHVMRIGTLSKALGGSGGFFAGPREIVDWVRNAGRGYLFSTALPEAWCGGALAALALVQQESSLRQRVQQAAAVLRQELRLAGWNLGVSQSQIIPVIVGEAKTALALSGRLREKGFLVPAIRYPTVAEGEARLRISVRATHSDQQIRELIEAFGTA